MIEKRRAIFIDAFLPDNPGPLRKLEEKAREEHVPVICRQTQGLLSMLLAARQPSLILEIGTGIGFSALFMRSVCPGAQIDTIENYGIRIARAKENFENLAARESIRILEGDAAKVLPTLTGQYDFIFVDASKGQYVNFLGDCLRLLSPGGLLVSDNVLREGIVMESRYAVRRRNRTLHKRMREYLTRISHDPRLVSVILPVGDGVAVSVKKCTPL